MNSHFPIGIKRLAFFGAALGLLAAGMVSGRAQSFTTWGGIGFECNPENYSAVLGETTIDVLVNLNQINDGHNDFDNSGDDLEGCIDVYNTIYEYENIWTSRLLKNSKKV